MPTPTTASMINLPAVQRFARSPALLSPQHVAELHALAMSSERCERTTDQHVAQVAATYGISPTPSADRKPFLFANGVAVVPVWGALLHRDAWCDSWATGYDYIASRFSAAMGDPDVKGIVLDLNSYGGHVAGNFELAEMIRQARETKPVAAIVDSRALSGGYSLASAATKIFATPSADIGSIGVVLTHMSYEKMMEDFGIEVTFVFAGDHKVDGNPYEKLPDDVKAALQSSVQRSYEQFVSLVSINRGLDVEAVQATQARVYDAEEALSLKLVDAVMPARAAYAAFMEEVSSDSSLSSQQKKGKKMSTENQKQKRAGGDEEEEISRADVDNARNDGAKAEQARISGILACDEAKGKTKLAQHYAFKTSMSVEDAKAALAVAGSEEAAAPNHNRLAAAMEGDKNKTVGVDGGGEDEGEQKRSARLLDAARKAGIRLNKKQ